jgi:hypothetical protein
MVRDTHIYGEVKSKAGLTTIVKEIRRDVEKAHRYKATESKYKGGAQGMYVT